MSDILDIYALSPLQKGILFHTLYDQEDESSSPYIVQISFLLRGNLNIPTFEKSWEYVINRHEILRSAFVWEKVKNPLQAVYNQVPFALKEEDWSSMSSEEREEQVKLFLESDRKQRFQLDEAPLMRVAVMKEADKEYRVIWTHHHILLDGWSVSLLLNELFTVYVKMAGGEALDFPKPPPYKKYIQWIKRQDKNKAEQFWRKELKGFTAPTQLFLERKDRGKEKGYGESICHLSEEKTQQLQTWVRNHQLTLNTLLQGAWAYLLSRYSGENDIVFGVTSSGRPAELVGVEGMIGPFINTLPARIGVADDVNIVDWLLEIQRNGIERRQYEHSSLTEIQGWSEVPREVPLFRTLYVFENYPTEKDNVNSELEITQVQSVEQSNYPLNLVVIPGKQLSLRLMYDRSRFKETTINLMQGHLLQIVNQMMQNPELSLSDIIYVTEIEQSQILDVWNDTQVEVPLDCVIHELFDKQVATNPEAIAVVYEDQQLTYRELHKRSNQLAHYLQKQGVGPESLVGLCVERSPEMIVGLLGILKAGGAYVPLDPTYPEKRLRYILEDARIQILVSQERLQAQNWLPETIQTIYLDKDKEKIAQESVISPVTGATAKNLAYVIYTSGSTGNPKGVMIEHKGICNLVYAQIEFQNLNTDSRVIQFASISFDASVFEIFSSLVVGATLFLANQEDVLPGQQLINFLQENRITHATLPPPILAMLDGAMLTDLTVLVSAGSSCTEEIISKWSNGRKFVNGYGPTETTVCATINICERNDMPHIGRPISNIEVYILDSNTQLVPIGVVGELYLGGAGLARGYLNRPDLTEERFILHPFNKQPGARLYRTGDLGKYLPDGNIEYIGRVDHQVKIRGFRIELEEIEATLHELSSVKESIVLVREDQQGDKRLVAYVVGEGSIAEWKEHLKAYLPSYMVPAYFIAMESFPLTPNGKIDREALPAPNGKQIGDDYIAPRNPVEELVVSVWEKVLGIENIGAHDSFFELGGHSLLATQVVSHLKEAFQINLSLRELFEYPTVEKLADRIDQLRKGKKNKDLMPLIFHSDKGSVSLQEYIQEQEEVNNDEELSDLLMQLEEMSEEEAQELLVKTVEKGVRI